MLKIANVLIGTDFGEASKAALDYGREFARTFGARLHVVHVLQNPLLWAGPEVLGVDFGRVQRELEQGARSTLDHLLTEEDRTQLDVISVILQGSSPAIELVRYAGAAGIDLTILGTHGRGVVSHLLMGSVAEKTVRIAPCPVMTVRHPQHEFIMPDALQRLESVLL